MYRLVHSSGHTSSHVLGALLLMLFAGACAASSEQSQKPADRMRWDVLQDWTSGAVRHQNTQARANDYTGGNFDVLGDGALLLQKTDSTQSLWATDIFRSKGRWTSAWKVIPAEQRPVRLHAELGVYGQPQDMTAGWTKFAGNPLVAPRGWRHATATTLQTPDTLWANDPSLVRGRGPYEGQWLLMFNVGGWAVGGWAAAVADSLAPVKRGDNPFRLIDPYPLFTENAANDTLGYHAPNDWIEVDGMWYAPDESRDRVSRMWTSTTLTDWTNRGPIDGIRGHDPGMGYDGERFYLFTEDGNQLQYLSTTDPLSPWTPHGVALDVGDHTGDADLAYFNNAWHMFFDDAPHRDYTIGYARTQPSAFPQGWQLTNDVFGPQRPDQGQMWDEPTEAGNRFGTGDADIAVEGTTLYMVYERPVGIAYKELDLTDDTEQTVRVRMEIDTDGDGTVDQTGAWQTVTTQQPAVDVTGAPGQQVRLTVEMATVNEQESPMLHQLDLIMGPATETSN